MEEKAKFIPKNKVKDNNTNTKFAIDLYNNALDMADEIIILYKSLKPTYLANMHTKKRKTKTQTSDWKVLGKEIDNNSSLLTRNIVQEISQLIESINLLKDTFTRLKKVETIKLEFKEESSLIQSIQDLENHKKEL